MNNTNWIKEFEDKYGAFELCEVVNKKDHDRIKSFITSLLKDKDDYWKVRLQLVENRETQSREQTLKDTREKVEGMKHKETKIDGLLGEILIKDYLETRNLILDDLLEELK